MNQNAQCLVCERSAREVPLIALQYQDEQYRICPSHFPIPIHEPEQLVGKLPGVEKLSLHQH